jgi:hypothetical protein
MIFSKADYLVQLLASKANNYKLYKYCKQTRWPIRVHLKFQQLNRIMYVSLSSGPKAALFRLAKFLLEAVVQSVDKSLRFGSGNFSPEIL